MAYYITYDGGGTKIKAVVFDDDFNVLSYKTGGGINGNFYKTEDILNHIDMSVGEAVREAGVSIDVSYSVMLAGGEEIDKRLKQYLPNAQFKRFGEQYFNLLSAKFSLDGVSVICGTGVSVIWQPSEGRGAIMGGMGAYIGDEGGGYYMGEHAIRAAIQSIRGWGRQTVLADLLLELASSPSKYFYGREFSHIPMHMKISGFTRQLKTACNMGDPVALEIVADAGGKLALQTIALYKQHEIPQSVPAVMNGGAWKTSPIIKERFAQILHSVFPDIEIITPLLEPVAGGAVTNAIERGILNVETKNIIIKNFKGV
ncbi:MAG: hypothetical protein FWF15_01535 [Oscillospiraceae bacterium]|nr:hypothetical protein [Oscillospiraceae bacterium]